MIMNINALILVLLSTSSMFSCWCLRQRIEPLKTDEEYYLVEAMLPKAVRPFLKDFASWELSEQRKVRPNAYDIEVYGLSADKQIAYGGDLSYWLDCRILRSAERINLKQCLSYLRNLHPNSPRSIAKLD